MDGAPRRVYGFTLLELLTCITVATLLLGLGVPAMTDFIEKQRVDAEARQIWRQLVSAREFAVYSGYQTTFCGIDSERVCIKDNIQEFLVFVDTNKNQAHDEGELIVARFNTPTTTDVSFRASNQRRMTYNNDGSARQFGNVTLCPHSGNPQHIRKVAFNRAGRSYLLRDKTGNGVINNYNGTEVSCE